ncbi:MAG TPA: MFS transporter [Solirubrobacteraceae bacterium]|nr:MFS transporter [Solirubrobacteraceae bacterium]
MKGVLRVAAFRRLLAAYTLNELAWSFGTLALSYLVYRRTGSAIGAAAFYVCSMFVPAFLAPAIVARLDRRPVRLVLPALYGGEAVLYALLAALTRHFTLAPVLAITLLDGALALTARPIARAAVASATSPLGLLREGNAVVNVAFSLTYLLGPAIAGAVVALGGTSLALLVNVGVFASISVVLLSSARLPAPDVPAEQPARGRVRAALTYTRGHRATRVLLGLHASGLIFFTISIPVEVVYAQHTLHAGAGGYGALLSAWGAGSIAGSAIYARWRSAPARALMALGAVTIAIGFGGMAAAPTLAVAVAAAGIAGIGVVVGQVAARTAIQEQTDSQWMALVMSFVGAVEQVVPGTGIILGGALTAIASPRFALAVGSAGAFAVTIAIWWLLRERMGFHEPAADARL